MRVRIASHNMGNGSRLLAEALSQRLGKRVLRLRREGGRYIPRPTDMIINWGRGDGSQPNCRMLNRPENVRAAQDKLLTLQKLQANGVSVPEFTTDARVAHGWVQERPLSSKEVAGFARTLLRASSARGIVPFYHATEYGPEGDEFPNAPLYTKYIKKSAEYRVHVVNGHVVDYAQKKARQGEEVNYQIRSHDNGWVFARENVTPPPDVLDEALKAVMALGLDFGAVDVIYNQYHNQAYVLEVNTAPGLEGTTVERYADALVEVIRS